MQVKNKFLAISGSTRVNSSNSVLINAIAFLFAEEVEIILSPSIDTLPHFNTDYKEDNTPAAVTQFRKAIDSADAVLICTPEYAHGIPGSLKNAIDWTVGTNQFSNKLTCLITASTDGQYAHKALLETLRVLEAKHLDELQMAVSFIQSKVDKEEGIIDEMLKEKIMQIIKKMIDYCTIENEKEN
jgi:chromate reductase, NAD(P)H dehydrogenase (quinone)